MQAEQVVADLHFPGSESDVLQAGRIFLRKREVFLYDARGGFRTGNLFVRQPDHADQTAVVHDTLELPAAFQEACDGILVLHLLGDDEPAREGIETACRAAVFLRGLCQEQIADMVQVRPLVEMPFKAAAEETQVIPADIRSVALLDKDVLLVDDAVVRQNPDSLRPCGMEGLVLGTCQREHFRQLHPVGHGNVGILADDTPMLDGHQRKPAFQCGGFHYISHTFRFFGVGQINRRKPFRLMM